MSLPETDRNAPRDDAARGGRLLRSPTTRKLLLGALAASLAIFAFGWALPNVAGSMFVSVRAVVTPIAADTGPTVIVSSGDAIQARALSLDVEVTNGYPLGVVLGTDPIAYVGAIYAHDSGGQLSRVWRSGLGDPAIEEGSDSPVGGGTAGGAIVVPPGSTRHQVAGGASAFSLTDAAGAPLPAGVYYVRVWAYGIASPLVPFFVDVSSDPLGPPTSLPTL
jgi:hypothetical protein